MFRQPILAFCLLIASICAFGPAAEAQTDAPARAYHKQDPNGTAMDRWMSANGRRAYRRAQQAILNASKKASGGSQRDSAGDACSAFDDCVSDAPAVPEDAPSGGQSETAIAVDPTGQHVVIGFNDFRGLRADPTAVAVSASGFAYSDDGGKTFTDGGQLPNESTGIFGTFLFPQVFGDPDVKYVPGGNGCQFIYSSLLAQGYGTAPNYTSVTQTLAVHRSTDCGHTWTGPFEVHSASNPNGELVRGNPVDGADKEFIDVDPDTGRVIVSWSNFTSATFSFSGVQLLSSYSDDIMTGNPPSWSAPVILNQLGTGESGSIPRFAGNGSNNVYVAATAGGSRGLDIYVAASPNNGQDFAAPVRVNRAPFQEMDYALGNDRPGNFPGLAVDNSPGPNQGNVYVVYTTNNNGDGGDIQFSRSVDGGYSFSAPQYLNSNPGFDQSQWFPYITVDSKTGRVSVVYYDQGVAPTGDMTELTWTYSDNGGVTWSKPVALSARPFHAGYGNDTGQPNLGDYIGAVSNAGVLLAAFAVTPPVALFTDGQAVSPDGSGFPYPNVTVLKGTTAALPVRLSGVTYKESGGNGFIDAGDEVRLQIPLQNYNTNFQVRPSSLTGVTGTLTTSTPGVTVTKGTSSYGTIFVGGGSLNAQDFVVQLGPDFVPGTRIEFSLAVSSPDGTVALPFTELTGTPVATQVFAEDFESVKPGALPKGWTATHAAPALPKGTPPPGYVVPWTTNSSFCGASSNGLYHINANDGPASKTVVDQSRWERAFSPVITIPATSDYVTLDFDVCTNTEDDPEFPLTAYDGALLRITDMTTGRTLRSNLIEAFAENFKTGDAYFYPKHLPRNGGANYLQDLSAWGGDSQGFKHVTMRLNGMAGSTVQLRWEYTQDQFGTCADVRYGADCGVIIDNIVMNSVNSKSDELSSITLKPGATPNTFTGTVQLQPNAPDGGLTVALSSASKVTMPASVTIAAGTRVSDPFTVVVDPLVHGTVTITATGPSNSRSVDVKIP